MPTAPFQGGQRHAHARGGADRGAGVAPQPPNPAEVLPGRRRMASRHGADAVLDPAADDVEAAVRAATGGYGVDAAFEAAGGRSDEPFDLAVRCTARAGRVIVLGSFAAATARLRLNHVKFGEIDVLGAQAHPFSFPGAIAGVAGGTTPVRAW